MNKHSARFIVVLFLIVSSLFTVSMLVSSPRPAASLIVRPESAEQRAWRQHHPTLPENLYAQAAEALRHGNLQEARQHLDSVVSQHPDQAAQTQVIAGLYAHQAGDDRQAEEILANASAAPGGSLEDWRLYLLAQSATRRGDQDLARSPMAGFSAAIRIRPCGRPPSWRRRSSRPITVSRRPPSTSCGGPARRESMGRRARTSTGWPGSSAASWPTSRRSARPDAGC